MIIGSITNALASARLRVLMLRLSDTLPLFKTWSTVVVNKARSNARAKGGRRLWRQIADYTRVTACSQRGATIECLSYIGVHKEFGGPIQAKNKAALTIPIHRMAYGQTAAELEMSGIRLFRPGSPGMKKNLLVTADGNGNLIPVFALCRRTRPQRADKWWPENRWVLDQGIREAKWHLEKGH